MKKKRNFAVDSGKTAVSMACMAYLPLHIALSDRPVLVIGGGSVAARKVSTLLAAGAAITVIAPKLSSSLQHSADTGQINWQPRTYSSGDAAGFLLVYAATDNHAVNALIADEVTARGGLVVVADDPARGNAISPAILRRGDLLISVSTGGGTPLLARHVRDEISAVIGEEYSLTVHILTAVRQKLLTASGDKAYNKQIFNSLAAALPTACQSRNLSAIDAVLTELLGSGFSLSELGLSLKETP